MTTARKLLLLLLGLDVFVTVAVFNVVLGLRLWAGALPDHPLVILPLLEGPVPIVVFALYLIDGYKPRTDMMGLDYTSLHLIAMLLAAVATLLLTFVFTTSGEYSLQTSRAVIMVGYALLAPLTLGYRRLVRARLERRRGQHSLVFLGDRESARTFLAECERVGTRQPVVFSVVSEESAVPFPDGSAAPLPFSEVLQRVRHGDLKVEAIILRESSRELQPSVAHELVSLYFAGVPTFTLELFHQVYWRKIPLYRINQTWLFQEGFQIAREPVFERLKRASDILLALAGLVLATPVIALAGIGIWLEDGGPVFFRQPRVGRNRALFLLHKLRTMRPGAGREERYTRPGDARITRIGRLLRATRVDEFPQLWNVLRGDMSLIGPRAEWVRLVDDYERAIPCYYFRHLVKPGITGWAQVNYPYGASLDDTLRKLEYDLYYIRHFSFRLDASIVLKTIHVMLFGKGR